MTNVSIIEIDLGQIHKIISEDVAELHGEAKQKLEQAIEQQKNIEQIRIQREEQKQSKTNVVDNIMTEAYNKLIKAGSNGVPANTIMELVNPTIANASAFTLRMKTKLREEGNPYIIIRKKINKEPHYIFELFNKSEEE